MPRECGKHDVDKHSYAIISFHDSTVFGQLPCDGTIHELDTKLLLRRKKGVPSGIHNREIERELEREILRE